jgi:hypothetical protein
VRHHSKRFEEKAIRVLVVSFSPREEVLHHADRLRLPFPMATDPERRAYAAYGMTRGSTWQAWHPRALWKYMVHGLRGNRIERSKPGDDLLQLGGDVLVDKQGIVRLSYPSKRSDDRPSVDLLLKSLQRSL